MPPRRDPANTNHSGINSQNASPYGDNQFQHIMQMMVEQQQKANEMMVEQQRQANKN